LTVGAIRRSITVIVPRWQRVSRKMFLEYRVDAAFFTCGYLLGHQQRNPDFFN
jgi:hypothetical protein